MRPLLPRFRLRQPELLSSAPALQAVQHEQASLVRQDSAVVFSNPGPDTAQAPAVLIIGQGVVVKDPHCAVRESGNVGCTLPDVEAGKAYRLSFTGAVDRGSVTFYRPSAGTRPIYLQLNLK